MATIYMICPKFYEPWYYSSPDSPGIGGSETMVCEMAWRLAERGHTVTVYAPLPANVERMCRGVEWRDLAEFDTTLSGLYILVRGIELLDQFRFPTDKQRFWCVFQDVDIRTAWKPEWLDKIDRIIGLCATHVAYLKAAHPEFASLVCQSRNGIRGDLIAEIDSASSQTPTRDRNPHRLMYASSPDRGLYGLLQAFKLIRFLVSDAELHVFYGWDNLDKLSEHASVRWQRDRTLKLSEQPGVFLHGRLGQRELYKEWLKSGLMVAPTNFTETGYISLMEAQALGAIPIVNPIWAAAENQLAGIAIEGDGERDALTLRRYAMAAVHLLLNPEGQEEIRGPMMEEARKKFDWSEVVEQYCRWIEEAL